MEHTLGDTFLIGWLIGLSIFVAALVIISMWDRGDCKRRIKKAREDMGESVKGKLSDLIAGINKDLKAFGKSIVDENKAMRQRVAGLERQVSGIEKRIAKFEAQGENPQEEKRSEDNPPSLDPIKTKAAAEKEAARLKQKTQPKKAKRKHRAKGK